MSPRNYADCVGSYCDGVLSSEILEPNEQIVSIADTIVCRERLGGVIEYHHRPAA